ncbi:helix-turn-helix domain-containing protein [Bacillus sp. B-jedd]|uniref:helix-turn-helix domain-containing protein n=1 Tax=Bacillus sp. B-jedd TaxID=1476857 RepID=UPI00051569F2|nr:helix-turn-helix domain-containing protein [Bacillus sp. B-jedd]CEG27175.1 hypothetical protein BN1002_02031 [Bacillus sp. B-jedd]
MKNNLVALSICWFSVCFVIGSWLISNGLSNQSLKLSNDPVKEPIQHQLLTQSEVADYLGISIEEVQKLTKIPDGENSYISEIPHIEIQNIEYYPRNAIDKWLLNVELTVVP